MRRRAIHLGATLMLAISATPTLAHADGEAAVAVTYGVTGVGAFVTFIGTAVTLSHPVKTDRDSANLLGWGVASTLSALVHTGFAIAMLAIAAQPCPQTSGFLAFSCFNELAADPGLLSVGLAASNVAVAIPAFYLSATGSKPPRLALTPLTSFATRGSPVSGLVVSGSF